MTKDRFFQLADIADECSRKVNCLVTIDHNIDQERIFISMFYCDEYHCFTNDQRFPSQYYNHTPDTPDLTNAEAFMRLLMKSAEHFEPMARKGDW